jgi:hypothetical protein
MGCLAGVFASPGAAVTTREALNRAHRTWRTRRRKAGLSWSCILACHEVCSGLVGRLRLDHQPRPACVCRCHLEPDPLTLIDEEDV